MCKVRVHPLPALLGKARGYFLRGGIARRFDELVVVGVGGWHPRSSLVAVDSKCQTASGPLPSHGSHTLVHLRTPMLVLVSVIMTPTDVILVLLKTHKQPASRLPLGRHTSRHHSGTQTRVGQGLR